MKQETEAQIEEILQRAASCSMEIAWRTTRMFAPTGQRKSMRSGPGLDFLGTSLFREGDDERHINWIATAQAADEDEIYKTVYRRNQEMQAHIFVDVSDSMDFGTVRTTKRGLAAELTAAIMLSLEESRDKVACTIFSQDTVLESLPAKPARLNLMPGLVNVLEANEEEARRMRADLSEARRMRAQHRQLVFVISDFISASASYFDELADMAAMHQVVCIHVHDPRERELPKLPGPLGRLGYLCRIADRNGSSRWIWNNDRTRRKWAENWHAHVAALSARISGCGCLMLSVGTDADENAVADVLNQL